MAWLGEQLSKLSDILSKDSAGIFSYFTLIIRFLLPVLALVILYRCFRSLLREKHEAEEWGYLSLPNGARISLTHWENIVGRSKTSDVIMDYPTVSRSHAAVIRDDKGFWRVFDLGSKGGVTVNNHKVTGDAAIKSGDIINLGGVDLVFVSMGKLNQARQAESRSKPGRLIKPSGTLLFLTEFQVVLGLQLCISQDKSLSIQIPLSFLGLIALMWLTYIVTRLLRRVAFEVETIAFFLCTIGLAVTASSAPTELFQQILFLFIGVCLYFAVGWFLRDLDRAKKLRWPIAASGLALLAVNLLLSDKIFGAKNWLSIIGITFQPSEFVKIAFVFAGAATLDRLFAKRNLVMFIAFSGVIVGVLALMSDFGTALVFFVAYLVISFIRSGDIATVFLSIGGAGFAGFIALSIKSHIAARFSTWGHAWEYANAGGYQQTRTMAAAASGGLFGVGAGNGWLKNIFAANTDMVFGMICEEMGLILAVTAILAILLLAVFAVKSSAIARSSFYVIAACAAVSILMFQLLLNVLGSVDILPFTGVTFPFVSKGGSSLIACWGLLAFIKAADTRQNASFAIKMPKQIKRSDKDAIEEY
jgi:cell division protein FtsW